MASSALALTVAVAIIGAGCLGMPGAALADMKTCTVAAGIGHDIAGYRDRGLTKTEVVGSILDTRDRTTSEAKMFAMTISDMVFAAPKMTPREVRGLIYDTCVAQLPPAASARD